ncbi:hypothetical protein HCA15_03680 [Listeria booriae]|uniref:sigma factor-like helix-turn-helix DNA-binding protein n=1 Tax=Listeria booriae TaxID=1552123 RepID=UPI00164EBBC9|nr:hypothetical protein [Listeria booriae]
MRTKSVLERINYFGALDRKIIQLKYSENLNIGEIAKILHKPRKHIRKRISCILEKCD